MSAAIERLVGRILSYLFLISSSYDAFCFRWFLLESLSQGYGESTNTEYRNTDLLPSASGVRASEGGAGTERMFERGERVKRRLWREVTFSSNVMGYGLERVKVVREHIALVRSKTEREGSFLNGSGNSQIPLMEKG